MAQQAPSRTRQTIIRNVVSFTIALVIAGGVFGFHLVEDVIHLPLLGIVENRMIDLRFAFRGPQEVSGDVVIAAIDSKSLETIGRWPWDRKHQASIVDRLRSWGASAVVFDVLFQEPQGADQAAVLERIAATLPPASQDGTRDPAAQARRAVRAAIANVRQDKDQADATQRTFDDDAARTALAFLEEIAATLPSPSPEDAQDPLEAARITVQAEIEDVHQDRQLAAAMERTFDDDAALTVLAFDFLFEEDYRISRHLGKLLSDDDEMIVLDIGAYLTRNENIPYLRDPPQLALGIRPVVSELAEMSSLLGYANHVIDQDGGLRRERVYSVYSTAARHAIESGDRSREEALKDPDSVVQAFMPLSIAGVATHLRLPVDEVILDMAKGSLQMPGPDGEIRDLPFDPVDGTMRINFYGGQATFPNYPFVDILNDTLTDADGNALDGAEVFGGKLVFIGYYTTGIGDTFVTPFTSSLPGVEKHANVAENLLHGFPLWQFSNHDSVVGFLALAVAVLVALLVGNLTPLIAVGVLAMLAGWGFYSTFQDFVTQGLIWNWTVPLATLLFGFAGVTTFRQITEARAKKAQEVRSQFVQQTFGRYLSQEVVSTILDDPEGLHLGGQRKKITILMSDLRGFTALCERSSPEVVIGLLNLYLGKMADTVLKYRGTVDEFIGDAVLALFGAPRSKKDDAQRAIACAVEMQLAMSGVNEHLTQQGLPEVEMGIALNTGDVIVGNIGSEKRTKYGVVGSNVNLTARIESYTVGGQVLISGKTLEEAGGSVDEDGIVEVGDLVEVKAKGIQEPIPAYYLLGIRGEYNLKMPEIVEDLFDLPMPLSLEFVTLEGKKVGGDAEKAEIVRISKLGGDLRTDTALAPLTNIKITVFRASGAALEGDLYAKVIDREAADGCVAVRFTSVPPAVKKHLKVMMSAVTS